MDQKYLALARKYRPHTFDEVVGQREILSALKNSLDEGKLHHAYLLSGTRGVGKTTLARIFAKALNCQEGVSSHPCGHCSSCQAIDDGSFMDLVEIDAASRTKVEDTRELLENVQYKPSQGRYKVYIIDEVHMLSTGSFNALLKTLEEPPEFVKFVLATTDPQKIPATILSRCMQLKLQTITADDIEGRLKEIFAREKVQSDESSLKLIAEAADGSMRDALSLADQAIALCSGNLTYDRILAMLGRLDSDLYVSLLSQTIRGNAQEVCRILDRIASFVPDYLQIIDSLTELVHDTAMYLMTGGTFPGGSSRRHDHAGRLAPLFNQSSLQLYYQILLNARRDFPLAPSSHLAFDMAVIRLMEFGRVAPSCPSTGSVVSRSGKTSSPVNNQAQNEDSVPGSTFSPDGDNRGDHSSLQSDASDQVTSESSDHLISPENNVLSPDQSHCADESPSSAEQTAAPVTAVAVKPSPASAPRTEIKVTPVISLDSPQPSSEEHSLRKNSSPGKSSDFSDVMETIFSLADTSLEDVPWDTSFKVINLEDISASPEQVPSLPEPGISPEPQEGNNHPDDQITKEAVIAPGNSQITTAETDPEPNSGTGNSGSQSADLPSAPQDLNSASGLPAPPAMPSSSLQGSSPLAGDFSAPEASPGNVTFLTPEAVSEKQEVVTLESLKNTTSLLYEYQNQPGIESQLEPPQDGFADVPAPDSVFEASQENGNFNEPPLPGEPDYSEPVPELPDDYLYQAVVIDETQVDDSPEGSISTPKGVYHFRDKREYQPNQALSYVKDPWLELIEEKIADPLLSMLMKSSQGRIVAADGAVTVYMDPDSRSMITDSMERELSSSLGRKITIVEDPAAMEGSPLGQARQIYEKIKNQQFRKLTSSDKFQEVVKIFGCNAALENFHLLQSDENN